MVTSICTSSSSEIIYSLIIHNCARCVFQEKAVALVSLLCRSLSQVPTNVVVLMSQVQFLADDSIIHIRIKSNMKRN